MSTMTISPDLQMTGVSYLYCFKFKLYKCRNLMTFSPCCLHLSFSIFRGFFKELIKAAVKMSAAT